jgi:hypothetical protein
MSMHSARRYLCSFADSFRHPHDGDSFCELTGIHDRTVHRHLSSKFKGPQGPETDSLSDFERVEVGVPDPISRRASFSGTLLHTNLDCPVLSGVQA